MRSAGRTAVADRYRRYSNRHRYRNCSVIPISEANGIESASANPLTGNFLIYFDHGVTDHNEIIELLRQNGYLKRKAKSRRALRLVGQNERAAPPNRQIDYKRYQKIATKAAIQPLIEFTVKRAIFALI